MGHCAHRIHWRACRFFSFSDGFLRASVLGTMLLALNCGLLGTLLVARRMAMLGDTLSHAVLPGIAAGFLWTMTKNPVALVTGAIATGVLSSLIVSWITQTTRLKPDAALSVVLTVFFAAGIALIKMLPEGNKAGLDRFLRPDGRHRRRRHRHALHRRRRHTADAAHRLPRISRARVR